MSSKHPEIVEETRFAFKVKSHGWVCFKMATQGSYGDNGYDDRIVLAPYGVHVLFEFKREGDTVSTNKKPDKLQVYRHRNLIALGHPHYVVYKADAAYSIICQLVREAKAAWETEHGAGTSYRIPDSTVKGETPKPTKASVSNRRRHKA